MKNESMNDLQIEKIQTPEDLKSCFPVIKQLRTHLEFNDFLNLYHQAHQSSGYEIVSMKKNNQVIAIMGYRFLYDFVHGHHIYIDDLITVESHRSQGLGAQLLKYAEGLAEKNKCKSLRLCTGIENEKGKKFYERQGWNLRAVVYKKKAQ